MSDEDPIEDLDLRGETCPMTFVRTRLALESMPLGSQLCIWVDHEPATRNIPKSAENWGQACLGVETRGESEWAIRIRKQVE